MALVETLQSNAKLLEVQILEVQKAKALADKELEAEKLKSQQKIKVKALLWDCFMLYSGIFIKVLFKR